MIDKMLEELKDLKEIDAILLGGSRATNTYDEKSDYDFYVYINKPISSEVRKKVLDKYCSYMEYGNEFWELEDDGILNNGIEIEFIYRSIIDIENMMKSLQDKNVGHGYTTCFLDNLLDSKIMFDKTGKLLQLKEENKNTLNAVLAKKIIEENYPLIKDSMPALLGQVKKAVGRNDLLSINHRITEYFAIYFDIVFAVNLEPHPGEKRMLEYALKQDFIPKNMEIDITRLFNMVYHDNEAMVQSLQSLSDNLETLLKAKGYIN